MARLCVRILANDHPTDPALTPMRTNLGDVVCIQDDGHVFSHAELNNGHRLAGCSARDFDKSCPVRKRRNWKNDSAAGFQIGQQCIEGRYLDW